MEGQGVHSRCGEGSTCLPLDEAICRLEGQEPGSGLGEESGPASWMAQQIRFEFFSKPMAPNKVMMASSAQPWGKKRMTLTQELIRRLLKCSKELSCAVKQKHLSSYMQMLKNSGYNKTSGPRS